MLGPEISIMILCDFTWLFFSMVKRGGTELLQAELKCVHNELVTTKHLSYNFTVQQIGYRNGLQSNWGESDFA